MTEKARHTSGSMMLGQPVSCKNKRKSRVTRGREPIFLAGKPMYSRVRVARVKRVVHRRFERLVMRRHRPILQTARDIKPAEAVFMQNEGRVAANRTEAAGVNPSPARCGTVGLQSWIAVNLRTVMRIAFVIDTEHDSVCVGLRSGVPA